MLPLRRASEATPCGRQQPAQVHRASPARPALPGGARLLAPSSPHGEGQGLSRRPSSSLLPAQEQPARTGVRARAGAASGKGGAKGGRAAPRGRRDAAGSRPKQAPQPLPEQLLGVDYGTRLTGLALGSKGVCRELKVLPNDVANRGLFARQVLDAALEHGAGGIVVGLPLDPLDPRSTLSDPSADSDHGRRCRWFAHALAMVARPRGVAVYLYDESETSSDALSILGMSGRAKQQGLHTAKERLDKKVDSLSAYLLLQKFYEAPGQAMRIVVRAGS